MKYKWWLCWNNSSKTLTSRKTESFGHSFKNNEDNLTKKKELLNKVTFVCNTSIPQEVIEMLSNLVSDAITFRKCKYIEKIVTLSCIFWKISSKTGFNFLSDCLYFLINKIIMTQGFIKKSVFLTLFYNLCILVAVIIKQSLKIKCICYDKYRCFQLI